VPKKFQAIKGVRDILPPDSGLWNWFEETSRRVLESYGFREIRLPIFEQTELFARSVGADTDIVSKEMYTFTDTPAKHAEILSELQKLAAVGDFKEAEILSRDLPRNVLTDLLRAPSCALRPEATASVVRAYIEHGMHTWPGLVKLYYVGPMFRRERPQKGRYRQFYQIGAEVLGQSDHPAIDAELMEMLAVLLGECRIERWTLLVNSIGCSNCRPKYVERLRQALERVSAKMCDDCQRRVETNPLRVLDCKVEADQAIIEKLPVITDHLDQPCREHFEEFQRQLKLREIPYTITPRLVRGLDYYTRTTFEITSPVLGAQNALVGGGRYDGLSELLGGPPAKCFGFALGTDRFIEAIKEAGKVDAPPQAGRPLDVYVAWIGNAAYPAAVRLARRLRAEAFCVELPPEDMKLKKSIGLADKLHARYTLIIGEDELAAQKFTLRRMSDGEQKQLSESELLDHLKATRQV
jgi:histidyl-tRNA synthetase